VLPLSLLLLCADWKAYSVAICCASALFAAFWAQAGQNILSLFAVLPLSWSGATLVEARRDTDVQIVRHTGE